MISILALSTTCVLARGRPGGGGGGGVSPDSFKWNTWGTASNGLCVSPEDPDHYEDALTSPYTGRRSGKTIVIKDQATCLAACIDHDSSDGRMGANDQLIAVNFGTNGECICQSSCDCVEEDTEAGTKWTVALADCFGDAPALCSIDAPPAVAGACPDNTPPTPHGGGGGGSSACVGNCTASPCTDTQTCNFVFDRKARKGVCACGAPRPTRPTRPSRSTTTFFPRTRTHPQGMASCDIATDTDADIKCIESAKDCQMLCKDFRTPFSQFLERTGTEQAQCCCGADDLSAKCCAVPDELHPSENCGGREPDDKACTASISLKCAVPGASVFKLCLKELTTDAANCDPFGTATQVAACKDIYECAVKAVGKDTYNTCCNCLQNTFDTNPFISGLNITFPCNIQ